MWPWPPPLSKCLGNSLRSSPLLDSACSAASCLPSSCLPAREENGKEMQRMLSVTESRLCGDRTKDGRQMRMGSKAHNDRNGQGSRGLDKVEREGDTQRGAMSERLLSTACSQDHMGE